MPRRVQIQEDPSDDDIASSPLPRPSRSSRANPNVSPFSSSDKENAASAAKASSSNSREPRASNGRLSGMSSTQRSQRLLEDECDKDAYDPNQDPEERRRIKKEYRTLHRTLLDSTQEFLEPENDGLKKTYLRAEELYKNVKTTSDATLDSRLLVTATDLTLKKATNLTFGGGVGGIDNDEFVGKCITFMKHRAPARRGVPVEDEQDADEDGISWARLGREAAFKGNKRPATTDFLLGPLSVTKRTRVMRQQRRGLKRGEGTLVRPVEISQGDEQAENNANTSLRLVRNVHSALANYIGKNDDIAESGLNLFRAVVNPHSFAQTIENIFYVSFLVKDGFVAVQENEDDLPVIFLAEPPEAEDRKSMVVKRSQMILSLEMHQWQEAIKVFDIHESIIPSRQEHREEVGVSGWYT
ncbi:Nse4-domain-containing protein [Choiromyces venosus 120613-1]|uniref:Non-structural maintenance of chromosomes element 4 n=1 Tax=Choiromyces venosus 120613-1 TaxID=1336337 RepID=A0A3N4K6R4_9PEZI|nr:Nse4-domain-containing protein [Choiromyces venosus 120613-1]